MDMILDALKAAVGIGMIYLFASIGEIFTERSGILNLGVEGMIMIGALSAFMGVQLTGSLLIGIIVAMLSAGVLALIHAVLSIKFKASQVVSGLAVTMFGVGVTKLLGVAYVGQAARASFDAIKIPLLSDIPFLGEILFNQNLMVYMGYLLVILSGIFLFRTSFGLKLRAVGENPAAADAAGINVFAVRYGYTVFGGMLAGLSGAYLSLAYSRNWQLDLSGGAGWIAVALVIFALWRPSLSFLGCILFGFVFVMRFRAADMGINIPTDFVAMLPYIATILVLVLVSFIVKRGTGGPAALGVAYDREER